MGSLDLTPDTTDTHTNNPNIGTSDLFLVLVGINPS